MEILNNIDVWMETFLANLGIWGGVFACGLILIESILPFLPICVFITLIFLSFGNIVGFLVSYIFTVLGCLLSYSICKGKLSDWFYKKIKQKNAKKTENWCKKVKKMKLTSLAILVAIPFTPASFVNVVCGLSKMSFKKFLLAMLIGKIFMVYFWGYVGVTLMESITHPIYLVKILIMLILAFIISKIVNKFLNIE